MRIGLFYILISGALWGQSMVESAAAAAGGSVGGVAGKKVSDGLTRIFNKIDKSAAKAAETPAPAKKAVTPEPVAPLIQVSPGVPKEERISVPPPPPVRHAAVARPKPAPVRAPTYLAPIPPPPPPDVTAEELKTVTAGMRRDDVLKLGMPSARITMFDEGHLIEIYDYASNESMVGAVHLKDGMVASVVIRN
jgi:hypothetical protein